MRIAVLLPALRPGGAERMSVHMARKWLAQGISVDFVLQQARGELLHQLPGTARVIDLSADRARNVMLPLCQYLRRQRPDALRAAMWPLTVIAPLAAKVAGFHGRVVISEHAPQSLSYAGKGRSHGFLMRLSMRCLYPWADARIGVSSGVVEDMASLSGMRSESFVRIHNPAAVGRVLERSKGGLPIPNGGGPLVLSVGTLTAVKRHDLLIEAFALLDHPSARLCILGDGVERERLEALVCALGLQSKVFLVGYQSDPTPWYANADLFVLSSAHEGFGNVIVEALEQGTPVVSTDCPSGPREILEDGKYGALVPVSDAGALAVAMQASLSAQHDRAALMRRANDFSVDKAADAYLKLLIPSEDSRP